MTNAKCTNDKTMTKFPMTNSREGAYERPRINTEGTEHAKRRGTFRRWLAIRSIVRDCGELCVRSRRARSDAPYLAPCNHSSPQTDLRCAKPVRTSWGCTPGLNSRTLM